MSDDQRRHIVISPVSRDKADEFEDFLRNTVTPAVEQHAPHQVGRWQVLREDDDAAGGQALVSFAFLFSGGALEDWDLLPVLEQAHGAAEAHRLLARFEDMSAGEQEAQTFRVVLP